MSGSLGLTSGDVLLEGRLPNTATGSWWATARGTYYRPLMNRFGDAVPGFADAQFKITCGRRAHAPDAFGLVGRETAREPEGSDAGAIGGAVTPELRTERRTAVPVARSGSRTRDSTGWP